MAGHGEIPLIVGIDDLQLIGQGGFASVYRGHQAAFRRDVAVKVLQRTELDGEGRRRFERECQAMGSLSNHPGIVTLFDAGFTEDERPYIVMAFVPDGTLQDRLVSGPLPWGEVSVLGARLAGALETAHRVGVIHRDVKPANVLRADYGPQLSDFGIARLQDGHETLSGVITASLSHAAPEILDGAPPTGRADVYSLGSTLFAALAGAPAFVRTGDEGLAVLIRRVLTDPVPELRGHGVPEPLANAVHTSMAKDPDARFESAEAFGDALRAVQTSLGMAPTDLNIAGSTAEPVTTLLPNAASATPTTTVPGSTGAEPTLIAPAAPPPSFGDRPSTGDLGPPDAEPVGTRTERPPRGWLTAGIFGGVVAALMATFVLWNRSDDRQDARSDQGVASVPATSAAGSVPAVAPGATSAVATENTAPTTATSAVATTTLATTVAETATPAVELANLSTGGVFVDVLDIAPDTAIAGATLTGIDGIAYDAATGRLHAAREPALGEVLEASPALGDAIVFDVPLDVSSEDSLGFDAGSGVAQPMSGPNGMPYGVELDVEGLAVLEGGGLIVVSEGSGDSGGSSTPFAHRLTADARFVSEFRLPSWYVPTSDGMSGLAPRLGLHGADEHPTLPGQVVLAAEAPLLQDTDANQPTERKVARLLAFDLETGAATSEWGYPLNPITADDIAVDPGARSLIVDIAAPGDGSLVVLESTRTVDGPQFSMYRVVLDGGSTPSEQRPAALEKVEISIDGDLDAMRSITAGPLLADGRTSLLLASDNRFGDDATRLVLIGLDPAS